jgi:hypothetical protein
MKKIDKAIIIAILILGLHLGCKKNDWYDIKSDKSLAIPTTLTDLQALMDDGSTLNTFTPGMGEAASDGHYLNETRALALNGYIRNAYTWTHEQSNQRVVDWINSTTNGSYRRVYYANLVLDGLVKIKPNGRDESIQLNNIKGQALFHRAHAFYELSQIFAPPYQLATANNKLGIPLRLESDINIPSKRSTLQQTYDQIINDLLQAKDLLPESALYKTRASRISALALLARVNLSMENYEQARNYADLCLSSYNELLDYRSLNATTTGNPIMVYNPEVIFYTSMHTNPAISFSNLLVDRSFYDSYNANDLRKKIFFNLNSTTGLVTYKGTYCGVGFSNPFSGLATDEVYLIRAECYARAGNVTESMADLNALLKMRWSGTYTDIIATNADDALRKVLEERKKELIMRGLRWTDLRRLNRDPRFAVTLTRKIGDKTYTLEPNSYKYTFPIPDDIIEMTGMPQNEGW